MARWISRLRRIRGGRAHRKKRREPGSVAAEHVEPEELLDSLLAECALTERYFEPRLKETASGRRIAAGDAEQSRLVVLAAVDRLAALDAEVGRIKREHRNPWQRPEWGQAWRPRQALNCAISQLLRRKLPLEDEDVRELVDWIHTALPWLPPTTFPVNETVGAAARLAADGELSDELNDRLAALKGRLQEQSHTREARQMIKRLSRLLHAGPSQWLEPGEAWSDRALADLAAMPPQRHAAWLRLLDHCHGAPTAARPSARWLRQARQQLDAVTPESFKSRLIEWLPLVDRPRTEPITGYPRWQPDPNLTILLPHLDILRGLVWCTTLVADPELLRALTRLAVSAYRKVPGRGPRAVKLGNACVWALGESGGEEAVGQLALLKVRVRLRTAQKGIDKALGRAAEQAGVAREELEEMSVPCYGLTAVGELADELGEHRARLRVIGTSKVALEWERPDGEGGWKSQKSVPAAVKRDFADDLKELRAAARDIQKMLPAQRARIEAAYLQRRSWDLEVWRERYLDHPLVGTIARRLIWELDAGGGPVAAIWWEGGFVDAAGEAVAAGGGAKIELWHPIGRSVDEVMAWRRFLESREIRQPFKQAHREIYLLTDAERRTAVYSNRFAAHIVRQHQVNALCAARGWKSTLQLLVDDDFPPPSLAIPAYDLRAEFWTTGVGDRYGDDTNEAGVFLYLATDQVRFYTADSPESVGGDVYGGPTSRSEPVPLERVPPLVLSEVLRDVDLFVGVGSVGNDPNWADGGPDGAYRNYWHTYAFGELSETAKTRRDTLSRLLPRLKIADRCELEGRFLRVRGKLRTYKIHLGSGNVMMTPTERYLCIVPARGKATTAASRVYLPFEGDTTMSVILSKAFLLAEDHKIKDKTIQGQLLLP